MLCLFMSMEMDKVIVYKPSEEESQFKVNVILFITPHKLKLRTEEIFQI